MIFTIIVLLCLSFFFSISETALTSLNTFKLQTQAKNDEKAEKLLELIEEPDEIFIATIIGNNLTDLSLVVLIALWAVENEANIVLSVLIAVFGIILFAEIIPRTIARTIPTKVSYAVSPMIRFVLVLFKPLIWVLNLFANFTANRFIKESEEEVSVSKDDLKTLVDLAGDEGEFRAEESYRIKGMLDFRELNVRDVMKTPRVDIVALPSTATYEEVRDFVIENRFTRFPVYEGDIDNIVGILHTKYLLSWSVNPEKSLLDFIDKKPLVVYEFQPIETIFRSMSKQRRHLAIVLDEYGGTEGILTHEDIIEAMIGLEIEDEMDDESEVLIEKLTPTKVICDGKVTLHRLNSIFQTEIPEEEDVLAAYLLNEFQDFPKAGDVLEKDNLTFKILNVEDRSIKRVQIVK